MLPTEVQGTEEDDPGSSALLDTVQEHLFSYWNSAKAAAGELYQKTYLTSVDEKLRCVSPSGDRSQHMPSEPEVYALSLLPQTQESRPQLSSLRPFFLRLMGLSSSPPTSKLWNPDTDLIPQTQVQIPTSSFRLRVQA